MKKKKKRVNKKKLISRLFFLVVLIFLIIFVKNLIFNNKDAQGLEYSLIVDNEDVTRKLKHEIYISESGILYMSMEDIKDTFDKNIFYEESSHKIITTSRTKVGAIDIDNNLIELNSAVLSINAGIMNYNGEYFIPISEMTNIYNLEVKVAEKKAIVSSLYKELYTANTLKEVSLKKEPGIFKKTLQKLDEGTELIFIEEVEKEGWIKVLTYEGNIGYIEKKNLSEKNLVRTDMPDSNFTASQPDIENSIELEKSKLDYEQIKDFSARKTLIENTIKDIIDKEKFTVNINLKGVSVDTNLLERLIIELIPRLREIGVRIAITNNGSLTENFINENKLENAIIN